MTRSQALDRAIDIAKESARGGKTGDPSYIIQNAYEKIIQIASADGNLE